MAVVRPFRAVRPNKKIVEQVVSLPYDVMNRKEATEMAKENPYSFLHICRSEIDLPEVEDVYSKEVYKKAKENIESFLEKEYFLEEETPMLYIYRQTMNGATQTGIVACVAVEDYENNVIKKHEFTRVEKELDRINHFDICNANTEPVFLTYREDKRINALIDGYISSKEPEYNFTTNDGVGHILWAISDKDTITAIMDIFDQIKSLYIADGHHRSASACKVGQKRREENKGYTGLEEFNFFMAAIFPDKDLKVFDYNRAVKDLNGLTKEAFIKKVEEAGFLVEKKGSKQYKPEGKHYFGMFLDGEWYRLKANSNIITNHIIDSLDVAILQNNVLEPILGISDPRTDKRIDFIGGIRGLEELERRVNEDMAVAFAIHPVEIEDLMTVSDNNMVMPPKSTWFEPKLGSGLFLHRL